MGRSAAASLNTTLFPSNSQIHVLSTHPWELRGSSACHIIFAKITRHYLYNFDLIIEKGGVKKKDWEEMIRVSEVKNYPMQIRSLVSGSHLRGVHVLTVPVAHGTSQCETVLIICN